MPRNIYFRKVIREVISKSITDDPNSQIPWLEMLFFKLPPYEQIEKLRMVVNHRFNSSIRHRHIVFFFVFRKATFFSGGGG